MTSPGRLFDATLRPVLARLRDEADRLLERRHGVDTRGEVGLAELGVDGDEAHSYKPAAWLTLRRALRGEVGPDDVFVDFGAGKGRVLVLAARLPFKRVVGVELSPQLAAIARANVASQRGRLRCRDVSVVTGDVLDFEVPDDLTVAFFYNPFGGALFETVVARLLASVDRRPRPLRIVYSNPTEHETLMATGRVRVVRRTWGLRPTPSWWRMNSTYVYEVLPAPSP